MSRQDKFVCYDTVDEVPLPDVRRKLNLIVVHYTAVSPPSADGEMKQWEAIRRHHIEVNKWSDIGYHFGISPSGRIYSLRPVKRSGAHCRGHNANSIGVVVMGDDMTITNDAFWFNVLLRFLNRLCERYNIPKGAVRLHRQLNDTKCPSFNIIQVNKLKTAGFVGVA